METVASNSYKKDGHTDLQEYWSRYWAEKENIPIEEKLKNDLESQPEWLQYFYRFVELQLM